jgi:hypothetical protein
MKVLVKGLCNNASPIIEGNEIVHTMIGSDCTFLFRDHYRIVRKVRVNNWNNYDYFPAKLLYEDEEDNLAFIEVDNEQTENQKRLWVKRDLIKKVEENNV